jgi:hypothetical protein
MVKLAGGLLFAIFAIAILHRYHLDFDSAREHYSSAAFDGNWSQENLADPAADGCPGQYKTWANVNHVPILIGCWGQK